MSVKLKINKSKIMLIKKTHIIYVFMFSFVKYLKTEHVVITILNSP